MISKLLALGEEQFAPVIVATARTIVLVVLVAALGGALEGLNAVPEIEQVEKNKHSQAAA